MQTTASVLVRMNIFLWFDARTTALNYTLEFTEPNLFNPTQFSNERRCPALLLVERHLADGLIQSAGSLMTNMYNYSIEVQSAIGDDWIIRILIVYINLLSPHRFSACAHLLAILTSINAVMFQFLRQYIDRYYAGPNAPYSQQMASLEGTLIYVTPDSSKICAFGHSVEAFERLPVEDRQRFASQIRYPLISSRVHLPPNCSRADWLFAFCVSALNDPRVDEVSQRDYYLRLDATQKYSPIITELLEQFQNLEIKQVTDHSDEQR